MLVSAMQGHNIPDEELFTVSVKRRIFSKKYIVSVYKNYIELAYKGELFRINAKEYRKSIFNSNKSFIFIFPYQKKRLFMYAYKKDMSIPLMEILSGSSIYFHRPLLADMWYS